MSRAMGILSVLCLLLSLTAEVAAQHVYKVSRTRLAAGDYEQAVEILQQKISEQPDDSEWVSQLAIAQARLGRFDRAMAQIRKAVRMGVAPERFAAEADNLLEPLTESAEFRRWLQRHRGNVIHGPMLGDLTDRSVRIWVRTAGAVPVRVRAWHEGEGPVSAVQRTSESADFTAALHLDHLQPETTYRYRVQLQRGDSWDDGPGGTFQTVASPGTSTQFTLAFGGGAGYVPENERMWETIGRHDPQALLLLGDNVYIDMPEHRAMQRFCYYRRHARPEFRALVKDRPVYTIWDDHDFGTNDCWGGPEVDQPAWKPEVWEVFRQNWANPAYGGGEQRPGGWYDFRIGDVHFLMLDGRYYRTDPGREQPSMLGPHQKGWLKRTLKESAATFKVLVSPVPWDFRTKGTSKDTWNGFRQERREIFSFAAEERIDGLVLMSADRHRSDAWRIARPGGYDLYEFNSSRLTNRHVHETKDEALFSYNEKQSFGLVTFDTTLSDPVVTYRVVTIDGEVVHSLPLKRSRLSH